jgi:putative nucleotidyltransferase with HDIG domain
MAGTASDRLGEQLAQIVLNRLENDKLTLPAMPTVALKALELLRNPDFNLRNVGMLIENDPVLAAQILRICNSAAMATREPCRNIGQAVSRLGAQKLRVALTEASARRLYDSKNPKIADAARKVWVHSRAVGTVAQDVAVLAGVADPDAAYLAGLLHDVGKPVVATMLLEAENQAAQRNVKGWIDPDGWIAVIQNTHRPIGIAVAKKWQLPEEICLAIQQCSDYDPGNQLSVGNAVRFANALVKQQGLYVGPVDGQENDALIMVGRSLLSVDEEATERLTKNLKARTMELAA